MSDIEASPDHRRNKVGPVDLIDYEDDIFEQKLLEETKRENVGELPNGKMA